MHAEANEVVKTQPIEVKRLLAGILPYKVGVGDQYFTTLIASYSMLLGLGHGYVPAGMLEVFKDSDFTVEDCKKLFKYFHPYNDILGFLGFECCTTSQTSYYQHLIP